MKVSQKIINIFKNDLYKDQREMVVLADADTKKQSRTGKVLRKFITSSAEYDNEKKVFDFLKDKIEGIPYIIKYGTSDKGPYIDIEYYEGIRVYNLLAALRQLCLENSIQVERATSIKKHLLEICLSRQIKIQKELISWAKTQTKMEIYPKDKFYNIINMLYSLMDLKEIDFNSLRRELDYIMTTFKGIAMAPFRDSTTKNMEIYLPELYLGNFLDETHDTINADERRKEYIKKIVNGDDWERLLNVSIIDFDFSSCEHLTSIYDDPIGFLCHEITWKGTPLIKELVWNGEQGDSKPGRDKGRDIAISFIVRYLRFGGRKLCYHILHPNAYKYRFRYDNEDFYFNNLIECIKHYWPDAVNQIPIFLKFIEAITRFDKQTIIDNEDEFEREFPNSNQKFYIDLFPY